MSVMRSAGALIFVTAPRVLPLGGAFSPASLHEVRNIQNRNCEIRSDGESHGWKLESKCWHPLSNPKRTVGMETTSCAPSKHCLSTYLTYKNSPRWAADARVASQTLTTCACKSSKVDVLLIRLTALWGHRALN